MSDCNHEWEYKETIIKHIYNDGGDGILFEEFYSVLFCECGKVKKVKI